METRLNSSWGNSRQFHEKILEFTLIEHCILQTAGVITKEGYKNGTCAWPTGGILIWQINALAEKLE